MAASLSTPISESPAVDPPLTLATVGIDRSVTLAEIPAGGPLAERLMEMGLTPGTRLRVVRRGFLGDPLQIAVRGYLLSIRKSQAHMLNVQH